LGYLIALFRRLVSGFRPGVPVGADRFPGRVLCQSWPSAVVYSVCRNIINTWGTFVLFYPPHLLSAAFGSKDFALVCKLIQLPLVFYVVPVCRGRAGALPPTSFRFHLTTDTLVLSYGYCYLRHSGLSPYRQRPCRVHNTDRPAEAGRYRNNILPLYQVLGNRIPPKQSQAINRVSTKLKDWPIMY
jgi:hypothetical protein